MKRPVKIIIPAILIITLLSSFHLAFFSLQRIDGQKKTGEYISPDGKYTITSYLNNGGATTAYAVLCTVKRSGNNKEKNIYWNYPCEEATVSWLDKTTVEINGINLDIKKDTYDFRRN